MPPARCEFARKDIEVRPGVKVNASLDDLFAQEPKISESKTSVENAYPETDSKCILSPPSGPSTRNKTTGTGYYPRYHHRPVDEPARGISAYAM